MANDLRGWKEIALYLGTSERTAQRWGHELGLPVHRVRNTPGATVFAVREELDAWRISPDGEAARSSVILDEESSRTHDGATVADGASHAYSPDPHDSFQTGHGEASESIAAKHGSPSEIRRERLRPRTLAIIIACSVWVVAMIVLHLYLFSRHSAASPPQEGDGTTKATAQSPAVIVVKLADGEGHTFLCRALDGGMIRFGEKQRVELGLVVALTNSGASLTVLEIHPQPSGTEGAKLHSKAALRRDAAVVVPHSAYDLRIEWVGVEHRSDAPVAGDSSTDECGVGCGTVLVRALQVSSPCGSCCGLTFKGCARP
jgi:hypothetical protein